MYPNAELITGFYTAASAGEVAGYCAQGFECF